MEESRSEEMLNDLVGVLIGRFEYDTVVDLMDEAGFSEAEIEMLVK